MLRTLFLFLTLLHLPLAWGDDQTPFVFCYEDQHMPPFAMGTTEPILESGGILLDMVQLAAQAIGQPVEFKRRPWKRCQYEIRTGESDALFAFIYSDERDVYAAFPKTQGSVDTRYVRLARYLVFVPQDSTLGWDGQQFTPSLPRVESVPGYVAEMMLESMGIQTPLKVQPIDALPLVASGRLDGYIIDEFIGRHLVQTLQLESEVRALEVAFFEQPWFIAFSKQRYAADAFAVEAFWSALREVRETQGERIMEAYQ